MKPQKVTFFTRANWFDDVKSEKSFLFSYFILFINSFIFFITYFTEVLHIDHCFFLHFLYPFARVDEEEIFHIFKFIKREREKETFSSIHNVSFVTIHKKWWKIGKIFLIKKIDIHGQHFSSSTLLKFLEHYHRIQ